MEYFIFLLQKSIKSFFIAAFLILTFWGALYHLTDTSTVFTYFLIGIFVCLINTLIDNIRKKRIENLFKVNSSWIIAAGIILVLYHSGFETASVIGATALLVLPLFGASIYESIVGLSLLIVIAKIIF